MGAVYRGTQINLDRPVAIKILPPDLDQEDEMGANYTERFKNEARAMAQLSHPGIVSVFDSGETADGLLYIVMEFVEGTDVARMVAEQGRLHSQHAMAITAHVCDALQYAHDRGIVHRDIKPANIMVRYDGVVKVADFGLAKIDKPGESGLTRSGMAMGTLHYMAPEALMLGSQVDHRADVYAVGVMLYQMLTGKLPQGLFTPPSQQIPGLDPRYDSIISQALRDDREIRYQNIHLLRNDLDGILTQPIVKVAPEASKPQPALPTDARPQRPPQGGPSQVYRPPGANRTEAPRPPKKSPVTLILTLLVIGVCSVLGWMHWQKEQAASSSSSVSTPAPAPTVNEWTDLLADDPSRQFEFTTGGPEDLVAAPSSENGKPSYEVKESVMLVSRHPTKNFVLRIKATLGKETNFFPAFFARYNGKSSYVLCGTTFSNGWNSNWYSYYPKTEEFEKRLNKQSVRELNNSYSRTLGSAAWKKDQSPRELEYRVIGNTFTVSQDGVVISTGSDDLFPDGKFAVRADVGTRIEKLEVMPLPDDAVAPPSASSTAAPLANTTPTTPAPSVASAVTGPWVDLLGDDPSKQMDFRMGVPAEFEKVTDASGRTLGFKTQSITSLISRTAYQNVALRARFTVSEDTKAFPWLSLRSDGRNYIGAFLPEASVRLAYNSYINGKFTPETFATQPLQENLRRQVSIEVEIRAIDNRYSIIKDGEMIVESTSDKGAATGKVAFWAEKGTLIEKLEVCILEATPASTPAVGGLTLENGVWRDVFAENLFQTSDDFAAIDVPGSTEKHYRMARSGRVRIKQLYQDCCIRIKVKGDNNYMPSLMVRGQEGSSFENAYSGQVLNSSAYLIRHVANKGVPLVPIADNPALATVAGAFHELRAIGDQLTFLRDGKVIAEARDSTFTSGFTAIYGRAGTIIEKLEIMPLVTADGKAPAASSVAAAPSNASVPVSNHELKPGVWHDLIKENLATNISTLRIENAANDSNKKIYRSISNTRILSTVSFKDCIVRVRFTPGEWTSAPYPIVRHDPKPEKQQTFVSGYFFSYTAQLQGHVANGYKPFSYQPTETPLLRHENSELSLIAVGDEFTFSRDGKVLVQGRNENYAIGQVGVHLYKGSCLESFEVMPLDGLTAEQKAVLLANPPSPALVTKPEEDTLPWTDQKGRTIQAAFVQADATTVTIRLLNGTLSRIPLNTLSAESQQKAKELTAKPLGGTTAAVPATPPPAAPAPAPAVTPAAPVPPAAAAPAVAPSVRAKIQGTAPFTNSLGMKLVPVPGTSILLCVHETRYQDYAVFAGDSRSSNSGTDWKKQTYAGHDLTGNPQEHPVTNVTAKQAMQFCAWLSQREGHAYRLPTNEEWTAAASAAATPANARARDKQSAGTYPWGTVWPPPARVGNYGDESYYALRPSDPYLKGYNDTFPTTAPVMSFLPNGLGLYDLGGNVWEMTHAADPAEAALVDYPSMIVRGASFLHDSQKTLQTAYQTDNRGGLADPDKGFRIAVEIEE